MLSEPNFPRLANILLASNVHVSSPSSHQARVAARSAAQSAVLAAPIGSVKSSRSVVAQAASLEATNSTKVSESDVLDAVIVGAGVSGMTAAQILATNYKSSVPKFMVTEARDRVGGNITTMEGNGYLWEEVNSTKIHSQL